MKEYKICNLVCSIPCFNICGYEFTRVPEYSNKVLQLQRHLSVFEDPQTGTCLKTIPEKAGSNQHTYTAVWKAENNEPDSIIHNDATLLHDILLLWSVWSNRNVCTGDSAMFVQHHYYNDKYFTTDTRLINAIQTAINGLENKQRVRQSKLFPTLFLMKDSNLTQVWQNKVLYLSPAIDVVSKSFTPTSKDIYSDEEIESIVKLKQDINELVGNMQFSEKVIDRAVRPFLFKVNSLGSVTAVDQLFNWTKWTLDVTDPQEIQALFDHCVAFNQFRNSVVHYAGLPSRNITIRFVNGKTFKVSSKADHETCIRVGIYYFYVFREIVYLWAAKVLGVDKAYGNRFDKEEILQFILYGMWRGILPFEEELNLICEE